MIFFDHPPPGSSSFTFLNADVLRDASEKSKLIHWSFHLNMIEQFCSRVKSFNDELQMQLTVNNSTRLAIRLPTIEEPIHNSSVDMLGITL